MVVLWRQPRNHHRASIERPGHLRIPQQPLHRKSIPLDPIFRCQVDGREGGQPAIRRTAYHVVVLRLCDGPRIRANLPREELVEAAILVWVRLHHFDHTVLQLEAVDEGLDVRFALGQVILLAHLLALLPEQVERTFPVQGLLLLGAVIQQVHADTHVDAHGFPALLARLAVYHVISHVKFGLQTANDMFREHPRQEVVSMLVVRGAVEGASGVARMVVESFVGDVVEGSFSGLKAFFVDVLGGHGDEWKDQLIWLTSQVRCEV